MTRSDFGGTIADYVATENPGGTMRLTPYGITFWSAKTGGTQYTDLLLNGSPASVIRVGSDGQIPVFQGPDGVTAMWVDAGGTRVLMISATNIATLAAQAAASAAAAAAVGSTTDSAITAAINNSASATRAAYDGRYAQTSVVNATLASMQALIDAQADSIATLSASLIQGGSVTPPPPAPSTDFAPQWGACILSSGASGVVTKFGSGAAIRQFYGDTLTVPTIPAGSQMHVSAKPVATPTNGTIDAWLTGIAAAQTTALPGAKAFVTWWHESNNDGLSASAITARIALQNLLYDRNVALGRPCVVVPIYTGAFWASYTTDATRNIWLNTQKGDLYGCDYDGVHDNATTAPADKRYRAGGNLITNADEIVNIQRYLAMPSQQALGYIGFCVPEFGTSRASWDTDGSGRTLWIQENGDRFIAAGAKKIDWYDQTVGSVSDVLASGSLELAQMQTYVATNAHAVATAKAVSVVSSGSISTASNTSAQWTAGADTLDDDLFIMSVVYNPPTFTPPTPAGWTAGTTLTVSASMEVKTFWKWAVAANDASVAQGWSTSEWSTAARKGIGYVRIRGVNKAKWSTMSNSQRFSAGFNLNTATTAVPSLAVTGGSYATVSLWSERSSTPTASGTIVYPAGYTASGSNTFGTGGGTCNAAVAWDLTSKTSSVGTGTWGQANAGGVAVFTVAVPIS